MKEFKERIGQEAIFEKLMAENFFLLKNDSREKAYELRSKSKIIVQKYVTRQILGTF